MGAKDSLLSQTLVLPLYRKGLPYAHLSILLICLCLQFLEEVYGLEKKIHVDSTHGIWWGLWELISMSAKKSTNDLEDVSVYEPAFCSGWEILKTLVPTSVYISSLFPFFSPVSIPPHCTLWIFTHGYIEMILEKSLGNSYILSTCNSTKTKYYYNKSLKAPPPLGFLPLTYL